MHKYTPIATPQIAETEQLTDAYNKLETAIVTVNEANQITKAEHGNLVEQADYIQEPPADMEHWKIYHHRQMNERKKIERERRRATYYGCILRAKSATSAMSHARTELIGAIDALRQSVSSNTDPELNLQKDAARCNIIFAELLCHDAYRLEKDTARAHGYGSHKMWMAGKEIDMRQSVEGECDRLTREWVVKFSGHGSDYRFDCGDGHHVPAPPYLTVDEAHEDKSDWEGIADTIGGAAELYNVRTEQRLRQ